MEIVIIGSGNVAAVLGRKFKAAGHTILQIVSRNASAASALAYEWNTESANYISLLNGKADVYIIAVTDSAIPEIIKSLRLPDKVVAHTAGSVNKDILKDVTPHYGVFYPLQSLRKETEHLPAIPFFYEGSDDMAGKTLEALAQSVSPGFVGQANGDERTRLHVAAVIVNNFANHLFALAEDYCKKEGLNFAQLIPLIEETAMRLETISPSETMTGPASRDDEETIQKHLALLKNYPKLQHLYKVMTDSIRSK